jgi:hypothetical protein
VPEVADDERFAACVTTPDVPGDSSIPMRRSLTASLLFALLSVASCKDKPGDTCSGTTESCADDHTKLVCRHERYAAVRCDGPKGCKLAKETALCDYSGNKPGTDCDDSFLGKQICHDGKSAVGCNNGKIILGQCKGPLGCTSKSDDVGALVKVCDTSIAKVGDACDRAFVTKPACSEDGTQLLECSKEGKFEFTKHCRGPAGCKSKDGVAQCDRSVQLPGDPCTPPEEDICSTDGAAVVLCDGSKMFEKMCVGPGRCTKTDKGLNCDTLVPNDGMPCTQKGVLGCQKQVGKDPPKLLECNGTKYVVSKACKKQCVFTRPNTFECVDK